MASSLLSPLKESEVEFTIYTPTGTRAKLLAKEVDGKWAESLSQIAKLLEQDEDYFDMIFLGFKPQVFHKASESFIKKTGLKSDKTTIVSMLAGLPLETLKKKFNTKNVYRIMPNTPCMFGEGITLGLSAEGVPLERRKALKQLLENSSTFYSCSSEDQFDQLTAITGSGPAYIFEFAIIMRKWLQNAGVNEKDSDLLIKKLFKGSGEMMDKSELDIEALRNNVTSPGGVTFEALKTFKEGHLAEIFNLAFQNNFSRSLELREEAIKIEK